MSRRILPVTILILALLASLALTWTAQASPPSSAPSQTAQTISITASPADQAAALKYWSLEARRTAKPMAFPSASLETLPRQLSPEEPSGQPGSAPARLPDPQAAAVARSEFPEAWAAIPNGSQTPLGPSAPAGTYGVYTSFLANYYDQLRWGMPYNTVGKLYIQGGGYCTASVISPKNIIVTAAHCVFNTEIGHNHWEAGWTFVPADRDGNAPYGSFPWSSARILNNWKTAATSTAGRRYDVAVITLGNNSAGNSVTYYTGNMGRAWNQGYGQELFAFGYPSNLTNGTKYTFICAAESKYKLTDVMGMGCNMQWGSSGGPWIKKFAPYTYGSVNQVNSVVSGGYSDSTWGNTFYGARFSSSNIVPLCTAQGC